MFSYEQRPGNMSHHPPTLTLKSQVNRNMTKKVKKKPVSLDGSAISASVCNSAGPLVGVP